MIKPNMPPDTKIATYMEQRVKKINEMVLQQYKKELLQDSVTLLGTGFSMNSMSDNNAILEA